MNKSLTPVILSVSEGFPRLGMPEILRLAPLAQDDGLGAPLAQDDGLGAPLAQDDDLGSRMGRESKFPKTAPVMPKELRGVLLALLGAACWGFSATCVSWLTANAHVEVPWLANMRILIAGAFFLAVAFAKDRGKILVLIRDRRLVAQLFLYAAIGVALLQISYMSAIKYTNPGTALLLQEVGVPLVLVYACLRARRLPTGVEAVALALAALGIFVISTQGDPMTLAISPLGLFWGLASGVAMAGYNVIPVRLIRECGAYVANGFAMLIAAVAITPVVRPWESGVQLDATGWLVFGGVVLVGTVVAYVVYLRGVVEAGPVKASLVGVFEPVSGAFFSAVWLGTVFSSWDFIGGAAIIAMMVIVARLK